MSASQGSSADCDSDATEMLFPVYLCEAGFRMWSNDNNVSICGIYV